MNKSTHRGNQAKLNLLTTKQTNKRVVIVIRVLNSQGVARNVENTFTETDLLSLKFRHVKSYLQYTLQSIKMCINIFHLPNKNIRPYLNPWFLKCGYPMIR